MSDIDTAAADSLKVLDPERPIREADMPGPAAGSTRSLADPGCVKTLRGITAPGILGSTVMRRAKKRRNLSSARHYDQIRFRFHTTKTRCGLGPPRASLDSWTELDNHEW